MDPLRVITKLTARLKHVDDAERGSLGLLDTNLSGSSKIRIKRIAYPAQRNLYWILFFRLQRLLVARIENNRCFSGDCGIGGNLIARCSDSISTM